MISTKLEATPVAWTVVCFVNYTKGGAGGDSIIRKTSTDKKLTMLINTIEHRRHNADIDRKVSDDDF